mmetsp:Transcript_59612/g.142173  ORF Transcript_59612/g.142173 Transcript_59612/m.142173 type:complete len:80 (-) Transcript_59612:979-1218(-)
MSGEKRLASPPEPFKVLTSQSDDMVTTTACMRITVDDNVKKTLDSNNFAAQVVRSGSSKCDHHLSVECSMAPIDLQDEC